MAYWQKLFMFIGALIFVSGDCFAPKKRERLSKPNIEKRSKFFCFRCEKGFISEGFFNAHTMAAHNGPNSKYILELLTKYPDFKQYLDGKEGDSSRPQD